MNFKEYLTETWANHTDDPKKTAEEFKLKFSLMETEEDVVSMVRLIVHVCGLHLGDWTKGIELIRKIKNNANIKNPNEINRYMGILNLGNNPNSSIDTFSDSDQVHIYSGTAAALANLGGLKNAEKFLKLADEIMTTKLSKDDSAIKALRSSTNTIISILSQKESSEAQLQLIKIATAISKKVEV